MRLMPCSSCSRHVSIGAHECPFCKTPSASPPASVQLSRRSRFALGTLGAAVALAACAGSSTSVFYGCPPSVCGHDPADATDDGAPPQILEGGPGFDAGLADDGAADASGDARTSNIDASD